VPLYLVSYDLLNKETFGEYETFIGEIRRLGGQEALLSQWLLRSSATPTQLRDFLVRYMHNDDRLLISALDDWASRNLMNDPSKM
jgi:hypothetical protein